MRSLTSKQSSFHGILSVIILITGTVFGGTIEFTDSTTDNGTIILINAQQIRFKKMGSDTTVYIPNNRIRSIKIGGIPYSYNIEKDEWIRTIPLSEAAHYDTVLLEELEPQEELVEISIKKYAGLMGPRKSTAGASRLDSIYRSNFYELCYLGYNMELTDEVYTTLDISGSLRISSGRRENPYNSGIANMIVGYCFLGWGVALTGFSLYMNVSHSERSSEDNSNTGWEVPFVTGMVFLTVSGISFTVRRIRKREYDRWERKNR